LKHHLLFEGIQELLFMLQGCDREEVAVMTFPPAERDVNVNACHKEIISSG
jgi:hypothetical protein